jgi:murein DD-endopeptidase MepM/ murein hydrolase activator NlpD
MSVPNPVPQNANNPPAYLSWKFWAGSLISLAAVLAVGYWAWTVFNSSPMGFSNPIVSPTVEISMAGGSPSGLPVPAGPVLTTSIFRAVDPHTNIPDRGSSWVTEYTVQRGDTLSSIADKFKLTWESILWGNTDTLQDDPNFLKPGQVLFILPVNGAFYQWKEKDTLESVAADFSLKAADIPAIKDAIVEWPGNDINPLKPVIPTGTWVIIPGGSRPFKWEAPMIINGHSKTFSLGPGVCPGKYNGTPGGEPWAWPTTSHTLSGYGYGAGHYGIDIGIYMNQAIHAAQAGVVVFAGWSDRGYGYLVIIDHLNNWHTFYAHLSQINVHCGQQVYTGSILGLGGISGNSTGPHLHFEMLYNGARTDPMGVLPPP